MDRHSSHPHEPLLQQIHEYFGFIPPFFRVIQAAPALLENFWRQAQASYIHNPLPMIFKEKLFLYLSYICHVPYDLRYHCISLHGLGVPAQEMVTLLTTSIPQGREKHHLLALLRARKEQTERWPENEPELEKTLFSCTALLFLQTNHVPELRTELQRLLGTYYAYLTALQAYIRTCHEWLAAYTHSSFELDEHVERQYTTILQMAPELGELLDQHQSRVTQSIRNAKRQISEQREQQRLEIDKEHLQQQNQHDNARLHNIELRPHRSLEALLRVAEVLLLDTTYFPKSSTTDDTAWSAGSIIAPLIDLTQSILGCERIGIMSFDEQKDIIQPVTLVGFPPEMERLWWQRVPGTRLIDHLLQETLVQQIKRGEALSLRDEPPFDKKAALYNIHTWLVAPIQIETELVGLLSIDHGYIEHEYTDDEKRLAIAIGRLIALVLERERLLLQKSEAHARTIALQETERRMNEFLSVAGHELKTPITSIKGNIQFMRRRVTKELRKEEIGRQQLYAILLEFQDLLARAEHQTDRLTLLVNDVMDISRIQAKKLHLRKERKDLVEAVQESVGQQHLLHPERIITLQLPDKPIFVTIDMDRIEQVITNYLSNALKYSDVDKPILVALRETPEEVHLSVQDEGIGLSLFDQQHIWERFYRVEGATVQSGSNIGLGLGLSICRAIIEQHGGKVGVLSTPHLGSTFWFSLPYTPNS